MVLGERGKRGADPRFDYVTEEMPDTAGEGKISRRV
jgi:hypothetical protein